MYLRKICLFWGVMCVLSGFRISAQPGTVFPSLPLVPLPQQVQPEEGSFSFLGDAFLGYYPQHSQHPIMGEQLIQAFKNQGQEFRWTQSPVEAHIHIEVASHLSDLFQPQYEGKEGYILTISPSQVRIQAANPIGAFYGVQSLKQLIRAYSGKPIPSMSIRDWPTFPFRGVMDDISRGPIPTLDYMKGQIQRLAELKVNHMTFYIEHVVKTSAHPAFAPPSGIGLQEWKELSEYAAQYHIELVGSFQSLGHFRNILSHPMYAPLGLTDRMLFPGRPDVITFLTQVYDDLFPVFSSPYFNINCDETWDLGRGASQSLADSLGIGGLYAHHVRPLLNHVRDNGKTPMMWADIALAHPEVLDLIPEETIMLTWDYSARDDFSYYIDPIQAAGRPFIICPGVLNSNRVMPDFNSAVHNIRNFCREGKEKGAMGVLNTVWDDGGRHFFSRDWYGVAYGAEHSWNPNAQSLEDFDSRWGRGSYGDDRASLSSFIHTMNQLGDLVLTNEMNNQVLWKQVFPEYGKSLSHPTEEWPLIDSLLGEAHASLKSLNLPSYESEYPYWKFTWDLYTSILESRKTALHAADLYKAASIRRDDSTSLLLDTIIDQLHSLNEAVDAQKAVFLGLWKQENREYWVEVALHAFEEKYQSFVDVQKRVENAKVQWESQKYLPPPKEVRLSITEARGKYFSYWMVTGPFPIEQLAGPHPDFLESMGGEEKARPLAGEYFQGPEGKTYMWDKYASPSSRSIDLFDYFGSQFECVSYLYVRIEAPRKELVRATFGSNDGIEVFINGNNVFEKHEKRSLIPDEDECFLPLEAGRNHLLLKVDQWKGDWGVSFRLPDKEVRSQKYKYYIVE